VRGADLTTFMCRLCRNSGNLNLLEPSGPVQACNGIALPYLKAVTWHMPQNKSLAHEKDVMWFQILATNCSAVCNLRHLHQRQYATWIRGFQSVAGVKQWLHRNRRTAGALRFQSFVNWSPNNESIRRGGRYTPFYHTDFEIWISNIRSCKTT
jgi:hypothetical protein